MFADYFSYYNQKAMKGKRNNIGAEERNHRRTRQIDKALPVRQLCKISIGNVLIFARGVVELQVPFFDFCDFDDKDKSFFGPFPPLTSRNAFFRIPISARETTRSHCRVRTHHSDYV